MDIHINSIIKYFSRSPIRFKDLFTTSVQADDCDTNRYTSPNCCGLVLTLEGEAEFSLNGHTYHVNKKTLLHAGPEMFIHIKTPVDTAWHYVVIHYENFLKHEPLTNEHFTIDIGDNHKVDYFILQLISFNKIPGDLTQLKCQSFLMQLIEHILLNVKIQSAHNFVDKAIAYIHEHFAEPISVVEIAAVVGCERRKLTYMFEKQVGMSPIQYLTEYRLKQAKNLLRSTKMPIREIAELVGYPDQYYFCRIFKKHYEQTPTAYRQLC